MIKYGNRINMSMEIGKRDWKTGIGFIGIKDQPLLFGQKLTRNGNCQLEGGGIKKR